ncbi:hypothetical protein P775_01385 [Puniceibacterium antarcticum]|uniref:Uncharacterized protein n=1 Tax=Puniceibacterium antarcticum TaxID=1206336 RepID=A0A2G8RKA4_9RHOB|nr:hypothetical protein P775_01385 [Puniceibacterium antarcticum]
MRFEALTEDFARLTTELFGDAVDLPVENKSENRDEDQYSVEAVSLMQKTFSADFFLFNYPDLPG